jgi:glycosyltransferase involved in cell wall biosynthesis
MRIAFLGIRGIPANYGGFETFAEQLGGRMVERGHQVTVYGRSSSVPRRIHSYHGMSIVRLPAPRSKYFETVIHSIFAAFHAALRRYDIVYVCNSANVPAVLILLAFRKRVVLNVDGLEWQRAKWNRLGKAYYRFCAWMAAHLPAHVVTDALVIQRYYESAYGRKTTYFPYGTDVGPTADDGTLGSLGLEAGQYVLYVSRLEPENNAHVVVEAYEQVRSNLPLVILGGAPYASEYIAKLRATKDLRIIFPGAIYGAGYRALGSSAALYIQATEVGGTHPALVEAMGRGNAILANDVPEHRETLGDAGLYYRGSDELATLLQRLLDAPGECERLRTASRTRAAKLYSWDAVCDSYEAWLVSLASRRGAEA